MALDFTQKIGLVETINICQVQVSLRYVLQSVPFAIFKQEPWSICEENQCWEK